MFIHFEPLKIIRENMALNETRLNSALDLRRQ